MNLSSNIARHFQEVYFGGNWTSSSLKETLADVSWQEATTSIESCNTIATLVFHIHYFVSVTSKVLQGHPLDGNDKLSFDHPPIKSEEDWKKFTEQCFREGEAFSQLITQLPETNIWENLADEKYGTYYRNLQGIIEHTHYHLGQIALLKNILRQRRVTVL